jgi:ribonuclease R
MSKKKKKGTITVQKSEILAFLQERAERGGRFGAIIQALGIKDPEEHIFIELMLQELDLEQKITDVKGRYYYVNPEEKIKPDALIGKVDFVNPNFAFVRYHETDADVFVPVDDLNGALHGDTVRLKISGKKRNGKNPEGQVVEILERGRDTVVGKIKIFGNYGLISPDNKGFHSQVFVAKTGLGNANTDDLVIAKILQFPVNGAQAIAEVTEVLGKAGDNTAEMHAIMAEFDLPVHFPENVLKEAEAISEIISDEEIKKRRDFREILTFTIDPHDAKDFDDALSYQILDNGNIEVGIHIADVSHYLQEGTALEKEAIERATSVYLVDRTIPMLPEKLSNNLCSLRPNEDKLVFSAVFEMNTEAQVIKEWFGRAIIHSDKRFAYEDAQVLLEDTENSDPVFSEKLKTLNAMAHKLRDMRFKKGAFNFETNEVKFKLDETGKPLGVYQKVRKDAHKLIEEFMLLANKQVATFVANRHKKFKEEIPFTMVYRVHEPPNPTKVETFAKFAAKLGFSVKTESNAQLSTSLNALMFKIEGTPMQNILEGLAVRTMSKARYSTHNLGHFGLAFDFYSHFTSPIRRYPDVMAHRMLQHYLDGGRSLPEDLYEQQCKHSSDREKLAAEAERASIKYKQVEFMSYQSRTEIFAGVVTGVTDFGLFVEIVGTGCEGMVRLADLSDDYYEYDADNFRVIGRSGGKIIGFGSDVTVKILGTDLEKRSMDLQLITAGRSVFKTTANPSKPTRREGRKGGNKTGKGSVRPDKNKGKPKRRG